MTATLAQRWKTSCHEAAHAVTARAFGAEPLCVVLTGVDAELIARDPLVLRTGGLCYHGTASAFVAAAVAAGGAAGDKLADLYPARAPAPATDGAGFPPAPYHNAPEEREKFTRVNGPLDWQAIAAFACAIPDSDRWTPRAAWVKRLAQRAVEDNRDIVLALAAELYLHGMVGSARLRELLPPLAEPNLTTIRDEVSA
jgi:hypothetical protein